MKKLIIFTGLLFFGIAGLKAQDSFFSVQYSMSAGMGDLGKFIGKGSFRGATMEWRKFIQPNLSAGFESGWNVFYQEKPADTYTVSTLSITGKQFRYQNQVPILAGIDYYFSPGQKFNPFAGLALGTMYSRRNTDMNTYTLEEQSWHFAVRPQVGFLYELNSEAAVFVALKYYNGFQAGELKEAQSYLSLNVGLAFLK